MSRSTTPTSICHSTLPLVPSHALFFHHIDSIVTVPILVFIVERVVLLQRSHPLPSPQSTQLAPPSITPTITLNSRSPQSLSPNYFPTVKFTKAPTFKPSEGPINSVTSLPTPPLTANPSFAFTKSPSYAPTTSPLKLPTVVPTPELNTKQMFKSRTRSSKMKTYQPVLLARSFVSPSSYKSKP